MQAKAAHGHRRFSCQRLPVVKENTDPLPGKKVKTSTA